MTSLTYPVKLLAESGLLKNIVGLEQQLLASDVRRNGDTLKAILHENFSEVGASGRTYDRAEVIALLAGDESEKPDRFVVDPMGLQLAEHLVLLRWSTRGARASHRCSLWVYEENRWQMLFHQGTLSAPEAEYPRPETDYRSSPDVTRSVRTRFGLRSLRALDADAVFEAFDSDPQMYRQGDASTSANARKYVGALLADRQRQHPWAITADDRLIGLVCATIDAGNKNAWVWYWMHAGYRGQSLTTRAVATLSTYLFEHRDVFRLELGVRANNPGSQLVAEKNGFVREGVERGKFLIDGERVDVYNYARLHSDPAPAVDPLPFMPTI